MPASATLTRRIGTRGSRLARVQTGLIAALLRDTHPTLDCVEVTVVTEGDLDQVRALPDVGGAGLFSAALERALLLDEIDVAVHSLKDLPATEVPGLTLAAIGRRSDPRDVIVSRSGSGLRDLPGGARVGTCSTRRTAQLRALRSDLEVVPIRGNVDTRLRKLEAGQFDAVILAAAGLQRLGLDHVITEYLALETMLPAPGQGALAVQCRTDDALSRKLLAHLEDPDTRTATTAERRFLAELGGGCSGPVAAIGRVVRSGGEHHLHLDGRVVSHDGQRVVHVSGSSSLAAAGELGCRLAAEARQNGAAELLS